MTQKSWVSEPLKKLRSAREELKRKHLRLLADLARLERAIGELEGTDAAGPRAAASPRSKGTSNPAENGRRAVKPTAPPAELNGGVSAREIRGLTYAEAVKLMLSRATSPLTINEMLQGFEHAGRKLSKNGYRIIYRTLRRNKSFESVKGAWWVARGSLESTPKEAAGQQ
jgi:hypothetical protein